MAHADRRVDAVVGMPMIAPGTPAARGRAAAEWAALRDRLRTVTPQAIGRAVLVAGVVVGAFAVALATLPALLPFVVGGLIAYALLPVVDALDRLMPRSLAALLSVVSVVAAVVIVGLSSSSRRSPTRSSGSPWTCRRRATSTPRSPVSRTSSARCRRALRRSSSRS